MNYESSNVLSLSLEVWRLYFAGILWWSSGFTRGIQFWVPMEMTIVSCYQTDLCSFWELCVESMMGIIGAWPPTSTQRPPPCTSRPMMSLTIWPPTESQGLETPHSELHVSIDIWLRGSMTTLVELSFAHSTGQRFLSMKPLCVINFLIRLKLSCT